MLMLPLAPQPLLLLLKQLLLLQLLSLSLSLLQLHVSQLLLLLLLLHRVDLVRKWRLALLVVKLRLQRELWLLWLRAELLQRRAHVRLKAELLLSKLLSRAEHVMVGPRSHSRCQLTAGAVVAAWLLLPIELGLGYGGERHARRQRGQWVIGFPQEFIKIGIVEKLLEHFSRDGFSEMVKRSEGSLGICEGNPEP